MGDQKALNALFPYCPVTEADAGAGNSSVFCCQL